MPFALKKRRHAELTQLITSITKKMQLEPECHRSMGELNNDAQNKNLLKFTMHRNSHNLPLEHFDTLWHTQ